MTSPVEEAFGRCWPQVVAATVRLTRDLDLAEDCAQDAFEKATRTWADRPPDNPAAWLTTTARNLAVDRIRREATLRRKLPLLVMEQSRGPTTGATTCCGCSSSAVTRRSPQMPGSRSPSGCLAASRSPR